MVSVFSSGDILNNSIKQMEHDRANNDSIGSLFHNRRVVYFLSAAKDILITGILIFFFFMEMAEDSTTL